MKSVWTKRVTAGDILKSRTGKEYKVVSVDDAGFMLARLDSPKASRGKVTLGKVGKCLAMLKTQGFAHFQENPSKGGFSYTVAVEVGVAYALRNLIFADSETKTYKLKG